MREIGCCTWIFGAASLEEIADRAKRAGLDGVELFGDVEHVDPTMAKSVFAARGLKIFSLTPADADISHPDAAIRRDAVAYYRRLAEFAHVIGNPLISCHGLVKRIQPVATQSEEDALLVEAVGAVCAAAAEHDLSVVFEILNRYETHQVRTVEEGLALLDQVDAGNLKLLPDAYHMNIEEADPAAALEQAGKRLGLYHAADSNRAGIGEGHIDFEAQIRALDVIGYEGPVILEVNAPGPNPFTPDKGAGFRDVVEYQLRRSVEQLRFLGA
jgi:sugar phosphate isomerase/epimerase